MVPSNTPALPNEPDPTSNSDWEPAPGEGLVGEVIDREDFETRYGSRTAWTILTEDGNEVRVKNFHMHLRELLAEHDPQVGDRVAIRYFGTEPGGKKELYAVRSFNSEEVA